MALAVASGRAKQVIIAKEPYGINVQLERSELLLV
jgi:hypothetical protein